MTGAVLRRDPELRRLGTHPVAVRPRLGQEVHEDVPDVDLPALVGGKSAFVGFTAGTGGLTATREVLDLDLFRGHASARRPGRSDGHTTGFDGVTVAPLGVVTRLVAGRRGVRLQGRAADRGRVVRHDRYGGRRPATSFADTGLAPQQTYAYRVRASNAAGDGGRVGSSATDHARGPRDPCGAEARPPRPPRR